MFSPIHVTTTEDGKIRVSQPLQMDDEVEISTIELLAEEIDELIHFLNEARSQLRLDSAVESLCSSLTQRRNGAPAVDLNSNAAQSSLLKSESH